MSDFDPWTATYEDAERQPNQDEFPSPLERWWAAYQLTAYREEILGGGGSEVLKAVAQCALNGLVMPKWLATAYLERYSAVKQCKVGSWDSEEAFGQPYPKGAQLASRRNKRIKRRAVVSAVTEALRRNPDRSINNDFWEEIGELIGECKTNAHDLYAEAVQAGWAWSHLVARRLLKHHGWLPPLVPEVFGYPLKRPALYLPSEADREAWAMSLPRLDPSLTLSDLLANGYVTPVCPTNPQKFPVYKK
jgi:hypothetical protein